VTFFTNTAWGKGGVLRPGPGAQPQPVVVDSEGGYGFPFSDVDLLAGFRTQLTVSFALW
jgi:hypothetical protein